MVLSLRPRCYAVVVASARLRNLLLCDMGSGVLYDLVEVQATTDNASKPKPDKPAKAPPQPNAAGNARLQHQLAPVDLLITSDSVCSRRKGSLRSVVGLLLLSIVLRDEILRFDQELCVVDHRRSQYPYPEDRVGFPLPMHA